MTLDVAALFREHNAGLLRFLERRGLDRQQASDIAQDAFLRLISSNPTQPIGNLRAYLYAVTRNLAVDAVRRSHRVSIINVADEALWQIADDRPSPETIILWRQELDVLRAVFVGLPPAQQRIFYLSRIEGCTFAEIGRRLGMSQNTVYAQLAKILVQMRLSLMASECAQGGPAS